MSSYLFLPFFKTFTTKPTKKKLPKQKNISNSRYCINEKVHLKQWDVYTRWLRRNPQLSRIIWSLCISSKILPKLFLIDTINPENQFTKLDSFLLMITISGDFFPIYLEFTHHRHVTQLNFFFTCWTLGINASLMIISCSIKDYNSRRRQNYFFL